MKTPFLASIALLGACALACKSTSENPAMAMDEQAMQAKWMEFATPGEAHRVLDEKVGIWKLKMRMFNPDGTSAGEDSATSEMKWIMDGRFLEDVTTGTLMGQPFHGRGISGYDNIRKKYVGTWLDNMGTGVMTVEGTYDPKTKTTHGTGQMPDVATWSYVTTRTTETMIDKDHAVAKFYMKGPNGKEYQCMQLEYTRSSR